MTSDVDNRTPGLVLPPYPYDLLDDARQVATANFGAAIDLSIGAPHDPPPVEVVSALSSSEAERGYPASAGSPAFRQAATAWMERSFGVSVPPEQVGATVGSKEFVAGLAHWLHLRTPDRDTVLYPAVSYPSYAMGADLAGVRSVPVAVDDHWQLRLDAIDPADGERALCLWINSPGNPTGALEDLDAAAAWGRARGVPVFSDECYIEFTWNGGPRTILSSGIDGVVAVHSLSKRSNLAGVRAGFYAGDPDIVGWLKEIRKHSGLIMGGPNQHAAIAALNDEDHVADQRATYHRRLGTMIEALDTIGLPTEMPGGGFYLWVKAPGGDAWALVERLAQELGVVVAPGEFYGEGGRDHVRIAMVCPDSDLDLIRMRARS